MDLTLSPDECALFVAALGALLSPIVRGDDERWGRAVACALGGLVGSTSSVVVLQCGRAVRTFGEGIGDDLLRRLLQTPYFPRLTPSPLTGLRAPATRARVWSLPAPRRAEVRHADGGRGANVPDPPRAGDGPSPTAWYSAVGITAELGVPDAYASAACHHYRPQPAEAAARQLELLRLLLPAFVAGARARLVVGTEQRHLARLLDTVASDTLLYSADGGVLYENAPLRRTLDADRHGDRLRAEMERAAWDAAVAVDRPSPGVSAADDLVASASREVRGADGHYRIRCTLVSPAEAGRQCTVAVTLDRVSEPRAALTGPAVPGPATLRQRYGLTDREIDVTHLLSAGRSNADIAGALGISPFTARRHTERVLAKLGARSRAEVPVLLHAGGRVTTVPRAPVRRGRPAR